ncbi:MAG: MgtC/SapB family protein [Muribaculaceae bacterium]|nr:MgtC/SapB family protein [Muribaculaceae bacterium]
MLQNILDIINSQEISATSSVFKLILSMLLGGIVGFERKSKGQNAGIRTFALISMGATMAMILSVYVLQEYRGGDPGRMAAQVLSGIGFLGAGAIIQMKGSVRGLTTAAGIWIVATIGLAVGIGLYFISFVATGLIILVLVQFENFEHKVNVGGQTRIIRIKVKTILRNFDDYKAMLSKNQIHLINIYVDYDYVEDTTYLNLAVLAKEQTDFVSLFNELGKLHPTLSITLSNQVNI